MKENKIQMKTIKSRTITLVTFINILLILCIIGFIVYYYIFSSKINYDYSLRNKTTNINNPEINMDITADSIDIPSKKITLFSSLSITEAQLTDLFLLSLSDIPSLNQYLQDLKVTIEDNQININANIIYNSIPLQGIFSFEGKVLDGKGVLHYKEGKIGVFTVHQDLIMNKLRDNPYVTICNGSSDIILDIFPSNYIEVINISTKDNVLKMNFKGTTDILK